MDLWCYDFLQLGYNVKVFSKLYLAAGIISVSTQSLALTKKQAYAIMAAQGPKWKLTQTIPEESEAKLSESKAKTRPMFQIAASQYIARINPIQFGIDQQPTEWIGFGSTGLEMKWTLLDPINQFEQIINETQFDISKTQKSTYQNDLIALMSIQFLSIQKTQAQIQNIEKSQRRSSEILNLSKMKQKVGAGIPLDIARAKSLSELDRIKKIQLSTKLKKHQSELALLMGVEKLGEELDPLRIEILAPGVARDLVGKIYNTRNDLKTAQSARRSANQLAEKSDSLFFPKFSIVADIGTSRATALGIPVERGTGYFGFRFELPLETGGLIASKRQLALVQKKKAEANEKQVTLDIQAQSKEAIEQLESASEAVKAAQEYVLSANEESLLAEKKYKVGSGNIGEVLTSLGSQFNARDAEIEAIFAYESAKISLFRTIGNFDAYFR